MVGIVLVISLALALPQPANVAAQDAAAKSQAKSSQPAKGNDFIASVSNNHDTIEAIAAVAAVGAAVWLAIVTGGLSKSTNDLATAAFDQVSEMQRARELAESQLQHQGKQLDLERKQLDLAELQHDLTEKQFLLAGRQCDLAEKQYGLQRLQFLAEHRPRIKIRSVGLSKAPGDWPIEEAKPIVGSLVIWNDGASDAVILETQYMFLMSHQGLPMVPPLDSGQAKHLIVETPHTLIGHGSLLVPIEWGRQGPRGAAIRTGSEVLYLFGAIRYHGGDINMADGTMRERWMGFCRRYVLPEFMGGDGRFISIDNPDYEYSD